MSDQLHAISTRDGGLVAETLPDGGVDTLATLRALRGDADRLVGPATVTLGGRVNVGDGGGGQFLWDLTSVADDDDGTVFAVEGVSTGRWVRVFDGKTFNVNWFGAFATASPVVANDAQPGIQRAITACANAGGGTVYVPHGYFAIFSSIWLEDTRGERDITLTGAGPAGPGASNPTTLAWCGPTNGYLMKVHTRDCTIKNFRLTPWTTRMDRAIDATKSHLPGAGICTGLRFKDLRITGEGAGAPYIKYGIVIGDKPPAGVYPTGCDDFSFERVYIEILENTCIYIPNDTGSVRNHDLVFTGLSFTPYGIRAGREIGGDPAEIGKYSFRSNVLSLQTLTSAAILLTAPSGPISLECVDSEKCARLLYFMNNTNEPCPIEITSARLDVTTPGTLAVDGEYFIMNSVGPLIIKSCVISCAQANWKIKSNNPGGFSLVTIGTVFPTVASTADLVSAVGALRWHRLGCGRDIITENPFSPIPDQVV